MDRDYVYIGSADGIFYVLDKDDGDIIWQYSGAGRFVSSPARASDSVYIGSYDYNMYAFETNVPPAATSATFLPSRVCTDGTASTKVTVMVSDGNADDIATVTIDLAPINGGATQTVQLYDDGTNGDETADDGEYTAGGIYPLPGTATGSYQFTISVADYAGETATTTTQLIVKECEPAPPCGAEWNMFHCNCHNTGESTSTIDVPFAKKWIYSTGDLIRSSPVVSSGTVYFGSNDNRVIALDADTGTLQWDYTTDYYVQGGPAAAEGLIFIGSFDGYIYALDAENGDLEWSYDSNADISTWSNPTVANGKLLIGSSNQKLYSFHATSGVLFWERALGTLDVNGTPVVHNGKVFIGSINSADGLFALDEANGNTLWTFNTNGYAVRTSPAISNGKVIFTSHLGTLYAVDENTGDELWTASIGYGSYSSPAVASGVIYIGDKYGKVFAFDASDGDELWQTQLQGRFDNSPAVDSQYVYIASGDGYFYVLDRDTGDTEWTYNTGQRFVSSPAVASGAIYIGNYDYNMYAFETNSPPSVDTVSFDPNPACSGSTGTITVTAQVSDPNHNDIATVTIDLAPINGGATETVQLYDDGATAGDTTAGDGTYTNNTLTATTTLSLGDHALTVTALDIAGATATLPADLSVVDCVIPNPPTDLTAMGASDTVLLTWSPPVTNEDGTPLTDLAGYNIYVATEANRCAPIGTAASDTTALACDTGASTDTFDIDGPALQFEATDYNDDPLSAATGAIWLDTTGAATGIGLVQLPLDDSSLVQAGRPVLAYMLDLKIEAGSGLTSGDYQLTAYTQASHEELTAWIKEHIKQGSIDSVTGADLPIGAKANEIIAAHAGACSYSAATEQFATAAVPLDAVAQHNFKKINDTLATDTIYIHTLLEALPPGSRYTVTAVDENGNESAFSNEYVVE